MKKISPDWIHSKEWKELRARFLRTVEHTCTECGKTDLKGRELQVDHIIPRSVAPDLQAEITNLRVLCGGEAGCNQRKGSSSLVRVSWFNDKWFQLSPGKSFGH